MAANYYDNVRVQDGRIHARGDVYNELSNSNNGTDQYQLVEQVPLIRELLPIKGKLYVAITIDDGLFCFRTGETVTLGSPIKSAYIEGGYYAQIIILLENGRIRLVNYNEQSHELVSVNAIQIDDIVPPSIARMYPVYYQFMTNREYEPDHLDYSKWWLIVTADNTYMIIYLEYPHRSARGLIGSPALYATINHNDPIVNDVQLDHHDILMVRSGLILTNDGKIYDIDMNNGRRHFINVPHNVDGVIDILRINDTILALTSSDKMYWIIDGEGYPFENEDINRIHPVKLLTHYYRRRSDGSIRHDYQVYVEANDDHIYHITDDDEVIDVVNSE